LESIKELIRTIVLKIQQEGLTDLKDPGTDLYWVPVAVVTRHVHLTSVHREILFGPGYRFTVHKDLQPGHFAARETLTVVGPKGSLKASIIAPDRSKTTLEISRTDAYWLGVDPPNGNSGSLKGGKSVTLVGPRGSVTLTEGVYCALRHIHLPPQQTALLGLKGGDTVSVEVNGEKGLLMKNADIREGDFFPEMHIDTDEANACDLKTGDRVRILKPLVER